MQAYGQQNSTTRSTVTEQPPDPAQPGSGDLGSDPDRYGGLSIEDDPGGTVDPADLAGTADNSDDTVAYAPQHSEADAPDA